MLLRRTSNNIPPVSNSFIPAPLPFSSFLAHSIAGSHIFFDPSTTSKATEEAAVLAAAAAARLDDARARAAARTPSPKKPGAGTNILQGGFLIF